MSVGGGSSHPPSKDKITNLLQTMQYQIMSHVKSNATPWCPLLTGHETPVVPALLPGTRCPQPQQDFQALQHTHFYHFPVFQHIPWYGYNAGTPPQWHCPCHLPQARGTDAVLYLLISILVTTAGTGFIKGNISLSPNTNYWKNITHFKDFFRFMMLD